MDTRLLIILGLVVIAAVIAAFLIIRKRNSDRLRSRFGPEYKVAVEEAGGHRKAEALLHDREKRVKGFHVTPLRTEDRDRYIVAWRRTQAEFVDDPKAAVAHADALLGEVMSARGYPVTDFEQRSADLSVDHPVVVQNYRAAHDVAVRHERGEAGTEDLRQAMIHYRALFEDLVEVDEPPSLKAAS